MTKAAMYLRVSTDRQTADNQFDDVRRSGALWHVAGELRRVLPLAPHWHYCNLMPLRSTAIHALRRDTFQPLCGHTRMVPSNWTRMRSTVTCAMCRAFMEQEAQTPHTLSGAAEEQQPVTSPGLP